MSQIVHNFWHSTLVLSFHTDLVLIPSNPQNIIEQICHEDPNVGSQEVAIEIVICKVSKFDLGRIKS